MESTIEKIVHQYKFQKAAAKNLCQRKLEIQMYQYYIRKSELHHIIPHIISIITP